MIILEQLLFVYFAVAVVYTMVLVIAGMFKKRTPYNKESRHRIALLVPAYKEDEVILHSVESHLKLNYPKELFDVIVIADSLQPDTVQRLKNSGATVIEVHFDQSTKSKSLNAAFQQLPDHYEIALICDADNVLEADFLHKITSAYDEGNKVIQAQRVAKNLNTSYAVLDGASEIINNHLFRKAYNALGLSSSLIGSGMAFNYAYIKDLFSSVQAVGGFDKILQLKLIESGQKIFFLSNALVFDEKIQSSGAFEKQRRRWLYSQFNYPKKYFLPGIKQLLKGNFDYFNLSVLYYLFPTRVFTLGLLLIFASGFTLLSFYVPVDHYKWWALFGLYAFSLAICLPRNFYNRDLVNALLNLPGVFLRMFMLLFKLKGANKTFIHTTHTNSEVKNKLFSPDEKYS